MQAKNASNAVFLHQPVKALLQGFKDRMTVIEAGGGLVHTGDGKVLLIFRRSKWDLPKGKVDPGETVAAAALREVTEETGLHNLQFGSPLTTTYHTYNQNGVLILKESHWFLMKSDEAQTLAPQTDEDIEKCVWVPLEELTAYFEDTHPSIIDVLQLGVQKLSVP
jgi:8-oxo-dGTP pyrophosphatase MutT (NUDIX family)